MVGGVSPGKAGTTHLGLPVFGSVKEVVYQNLMFSLLLFISFYIYWSKFIRKNFKKSLINRENNKSFSRL